MIVIIIPDHRAPSWNTLYSGKHWSVRSKTKNEIQQLVRISLPDDVVNANGFPYDVPVAIRLEAFLKGRLIDDDNIMAKYYIDALKGWVIHDDDERYVRGVETKAIRSTDNSVRITIQEAEDEDISAV